MIEGAEWPLALVAAVIALLGGYLAGSIPVAALVGRSAGVDPIQDGDANPGSANVWKLAGPGWGLLALAGDLAKGVLPVSIATVSGAWAFGWIAGLGALLGACWPLFGRLRGGRGVAVLAGVSFALSPVAGLVAVLLTLLAAGVTGLVRRNGRVAAIVTGIGSFPVLFLAEQRDPVRLAALMTLYLVALLRYALTRR